MGAARAYALVHALEGLSRAEAARLAGMDRQALRNAVIRSSWIIHSLDRDERFPAMEQPCIRLVGALMLETNDEWAVARRYMTLETLTRLIDTDHVRLSAVAA